MNPRPSSSLYTSTVSSSNCSSPTTYSANHFELDDLLENILLQFNECDELQSEVNLLRNSWNRTIGILKQTRKICMQIFHLLDLAIRQMNLERNKYLANCTAF